MGKRKTKPAQNSGPERKMPKGRPFAPGTSGNPGGRPREEREVVEALRLHGLELVEALLRASLAKKPNVKAIAEALNRAYGKAKQVVELTGANGGPLEIDLSKLTTEQVRTLRELVAAATPATPG